MGKYALKYFVLGLALFVSGNTMAQIAGEELSKTNQTEAYVDSNHPTISLSFATPFAGEAIVPVQNSDLFVRLSLSIWNYGHFHDIGYLAAALTSGSLPAGTNLTLVSAPCTTTNSGGDLGTTLGVITLSTTQQEVVNQMGNCWTGTSDTDGYQMTFTAQPISGSFSQLVAGTYNVTVTFTLLVNQ